MSKDSTEEGAGKGGTRKRAVRLRSKADARRLLGLSVNLMLRGEIGAEKGRALVFAASVLIKSVEVDEQRWAMAEAQPGPAETARQIREMMREADGMIPGPPEGG